MSLLTSSLQSAKLIHPSKSTPVCSPKAKPHQVCGRAGRPSKPAQRRLPRVVTLAANKEGAGSEQGRLLRDALEFNRPDNAPQQSTSAKFDSLVDYKPGQVLGGKYTLVETVGRGKAGVTYKAERPGGGLVAIKALSLRSMQGDWQQLELFEKEANALRSMNHPGIPAYKDYFEVDNDGDRAYFLVQELVEGKSLAKMVEAGWKPTQKEVERIADELLSTLAYLQEQKIVHRDVKPENIILQGGKPGGKVFLVDFGGIQQGNKDVADSEVVDTGTLVGTYGYMAPEQLRGSVKPASDLFALGGTLLYLLSGEMPSSFPQRRLQIDFSQVDMSPRLNRLLQGLLQPAWEDRLTATQAKAVLAGTAPSSRQQSQGQRQQQQKGWNVFNEGAWEDRRQRSRGSSSSQRNNNEQEQEAASTSGRDQRQNPDLGPFGNPLVLGLLSAFLPLPLRPLAWWLALAQLGNSGKRARRSRSASTTDSEASTSGSDDSDWMSGSQRQQERGFGFSDGPADDTRNESEMTDEEQEALRRRRRQQQMAAMQQQQMLLSMMRMMGGGMVYRGGPFGRREGFGRDPFMF